MKERINDLIKMRKIYLKENNFFKIGLFCILIIHGAFK